MRLSEHSPKYEWLLRALLADASLIKSLRNYRDRHQRFPIFSVPPPPFDYRFCRARGIELPIITTTGELARWLGLSVPELEWLADRRGWERRRSNLRNRNYCYRWLQKSAGRQRLIEMPKTRLKLVQRRLHDEILSLIPAHEAAHGFRRGRSVLTALRPHTGRRLVLHMDINEFFPSIESRRVNALFRTVGYTEIVARILTGLCTNSTPNSVLDAAGVLSRHQRLRYSSLHLPQGASTSPSLANLLARRLDSRLSGLARSVGAGYTRYADDLVFSGDAEFCRSISRFRVRVSQIVLAEGFRIQNRKTRAMYSSQRQQVSGLVLNEKLNLTRQAYDSLRAILHNCVRTGPDAQNTDGHTDFRSHLLGLIGWHKSINSDRGQKLRQMFDQIKWASAYE